MTVPTTITFRSMDPSPAVESVVDRWVDRLSGEVAQIERCEVVVDLPHRHGRQGNVFHVGIQITIPHHVINVSTDHGVDHKHEDVYAALGDAFRAARRQLHDHVRIDRGEVKLHA